MTNLATTKGLSTLAERAREYYERQLRADLERSDVGRAVAIHVDSGDHVVGDTHAQAARALLTRHERDGRIVTMTIGPPTDCDVRLASRIPPSITR